MIKQTSTREQVQIRKPANGPVIWRNEVAQKQAEDRLFNLINHLPLNPSFHNRPGITMTICRFDYPPMGDFDDLYHCAKGLEARNLVTVTPLGTATFSVTIR